MAGKRRQGRDPVPPPVPPPAAPSAPAPQPPAPGRAPGATLVVAPRQSRREVRQARRTRRRRIGAAGIAALLVIGLVVAALVTVGVKHATTPKPPAGRTQATVLMQVQAADRTAAGSVLLAHDSGAHRGVEVLVPAGLITDVCGYGQQQFASILALPGGETTSRQTLGSVLGGVQVDGSWVLTTAQLAKLVDAVGGVQVDVDVDVVQRKPGGGGTVLVPKGSAEQLKGAQAAEFATYVASASEDASASLDRLHRVLDALLAKLPTDPVAVQALLRQLGTGGTSTLGAERLAGLLVGLAADGAHTGAELPTDLPTKTIDSGGSPSYSVDDSGVTQLVDNELAGSLPPGGRRTLPPVYVQNGVGTPGLVQTACAKLQAAGFGYAGSGNAPRFSNGPSRVDIFSESTDAIAQGQRVAKALGLPTSAVLRSTQNQDIAQVFVILGSDYKP